MAKTAGAGPRSMHRPQWLDWAGVEQRQWPLAFAAAASCVAATIHAVLTVPHFRYWLPAGLFFLVCTVAQVVLCAALLGSARTATLLSAIGTNVVVIAVYVVSRTSGIPGAPGIPAHGSRPAPGVAIIPGAVEKVGSNDIVALVAEIAIVVLCASCLPERARRHVTNLLAAFGATLLGLWWVGVLS
jgi:hypothetical protein